MSQQTRGQHVQHDELQQDDEAVQQEIFGPIITVLRFSDEDEAIRWANGVEYGLAS